MMKRSRIHMKNINGRSLYHTSESHLRLRMKFGAQNITMCMEDEYMDVHLNSCMIKNIYKICKVHNAIIFKFVVVLILRCSSKLS